ncbi:hypothetical protein QEH59_03525 [Coraliomargarita sp. SDUM461004]|uniref:AI-2E family transporter n=1 Tax=Thalassobacterium sedimentorum TaxID=3041258 RepID=A0ABU1AHY1_9BACT|nr:hypothetical protein [Coraliomargarita sp. SDUM461004]MDQ8193480.1 hypothetical protein [Coraliomargarita sp. SDUM461004]
MPSTTKKKRSRPLEWTLMLLFTLGLVLALAGDGLADYLGSLLMATAFYPVIRAFRYN